MRQARFAASAVTAVVIAMCAHAGGGPSVEVVETRALTSDYEWGFWSGVKQPLGSFQNGLSIHEIVKPSQPLPELQGNPDYIFWVDETAGTSGIASTPTGAFMGNTTNPGGMATFAEDGTVWFTYGGRATDLPLDLYRSDAPYDLGSFTRVLDDYESWAASTTPCVHVRDGKVMLFWRHGWSAGADTTVRFRRYDIATGFDRPELEFELGGGAVSPEFGDVGIEQLWTRFDPRSGDLFVSWQWFDRNDDGSPSRMGSNPFLYSPDLGTTWKLVDGRTPALPVNYNAIDPIMSPHDHIAVGDHTEWMVADMGVSPSGTPWMTTPTGDASFDNWRVRYWFYDGTAWQGRDRTVGMIAQAKAHACGATRNHIVFVYAERAPSHLLKARVSTDDGDTWSLPFVLDQVDVQDSISWVSFVQPAGGYPDDHARFFYAHYRTAEGNEGRRYRNHIKWVQLEVVSPPPDADLDGDGAVGFSDLSMLLASWGPCPGCAADINGNGEVAFDDLVTLLAAWSPASP